MKPTLIGVCGYKGAGKTTVTATAILDPRHSMRALPIYQTSFVAPVYRMLEALGVPADIVANKTRWNEPLDILCGHSMRYATTTLGTEWGREQIDKNIWINLAMIEARTTMEQGCSVIIDGVRFPDELDAIRDNGGIVIAFTRPGLIVELHHETERHIAVLQRKCDRSIINTDGEFDRTVRIMRALLIDVTRSALDRARKP